MSQVWSILLLVQPLQPVLIPALAWLLQWWGTGWVWVHFDWNMSEQFQQFLSQLVRYILITVDMRESRTLTAKAVPQAKGCVRYSSVSGSSSSSWSRNWTLLSFTNSVIIGTFDPYTEPFLCRTMGEPSGGIVSGAVEPGHWLCHKMHKFSQRNIAPTNLVRSTLCWILSAIRSVSMRRWSNYNPITCFVIYPSLTIFIDYYNLLLVAHLVPWHPQTIWLQSIFFALAAIFIHIKLWRKLIPFFSFFFCGKIMIWSRENSPLLVRC